MNQHLVDAACMEKHDFTSNASVITAFVKQN